MFHFHMSLLLTELQVYADVITLIMPGPPGLSDADKTVQEAEQRGRSGDHRQGAIINLPESFQDRSPMDLSQSQQHLQYQVENQKRWLYNAIM